MKRAIIYYSLSENTHEAAEKIAAAIGAELIRVETVKPMPASFKQQIMYGGMLTVFGRCPKLFGMPVNLDAYDEIILGTPVWAGKAAAPMNTVLQNKEICAKTTAVFTLSGGGDNDKCIPALQKKLPALKHTLALADRNQEKAADNEKKIEEFCSSLNL